MKNFRKKENDYGVSNGMSSTIFKLYIDIFISVMMTNEIMSSTNFNGQKP